MVQELTTKPSMFGRLGMGLARGLSETVPKEVERQRLSSGLQQFEQESGNLSPMQQLARLSSIPGITPQMIQSFGELGKQQGMRNSLRGAGGQGQMPGQQAQQDQMPGMQDPRVAAAMQQMGMQTGPQSRSQTPQQAQGENVPRESVGQEQVAAKNPMRPEVQTFKPPSQDEFLAKQEQIWERNPHLNFQEAQQETEKFYDRQSKLTEAERAEDARQEGVKEDVKKKFDDVLETKLQKKGADVFQDVSGETKQNLLRGLDREIAKGNISVDDAVNKWTNKALDLAKAKTNLDTLASSQGALSSFFKQDETLEKLKTYQKIYKDADNLEEFYNTLKGEKFGMSPQAAAQIAYPRSPGVNKVIKGVKDIGYINQMAESKKIAIQIEDALTREDSLLAIAKNLKDHDANFNEKAFFKQINEDIDRLGLSPQQQRELAEGVGDWVPNWGDTWFFPTSRGLNK